MFLKNYHIVITGASFGLGKALAYELRKEKAILYLLSRSIKKTKFPFSCQKIPCDLRNPQEVKQAFSQIKKIDVLINCVGIPLLKELVKSSDEEINNVVQTNLTGIIYTCKYALPKLKKSKKAHIINISSTSGKKPRNKEAVYCASKWGLSGFTQSLKLELASYNIKVSCVYPGGMKSLHFWKNFRSKKEIENYLNPKTVASQIIDLIKTPTSSCPAELVIERLGK